MTFSRHQQVARTDAPTNKRIQKGQINLYEKLIRLPKMIWFHKWLNTTPWMTSPFIDINFIDALTSTYYTCLLTNWAWVMFILCRGIIRLWIQNLVSVYRNYQNFWIQNCRKNLTCAPGPDGACSPVLVGYPWARRQWQARAGHRGSNQWRGLDTSQGPSQERGCIPPGPTQS